VFATAATSTGEFTIDIAGHLMTIPVVSGESIATVADRMETLWNARTGVDRPPITAVSDGVSTVTLTATVMGDLMNSARLVAVTTGNEPGGMTMTPSAATLAAGSGTYSLTAIFTALASVRTPLLVSEWDSSPNAGAGAEVLAIKNHCVTKSNPQDQLWSAMVCAETGADTGAIALLVDDYDDERARVIAGINNYSLPMLIAADYAGAISLTNNLVLPRNGVVLKHTRVPAAADVMSKAERIAALNAGWCPLKEVDGQMVVTRYIMSRYDLGVVDANAIDVLDYTATRFAARFAALGPLVVVPEGEDFRGEDAITLDGVQAIVEDELVHIEEEDGFYYDVKSNLNQITTTYDSGGQVTVKIPASCLKVMPGLHNVLIEGNHKVDNA
jgi:phage tail sheath gpL-like